MDTISRHIHGFAEGDLFHEKYRLIKHLGSGGFADVWSAKDELIDSVVALKIFTRLDEEGIHGLAKEYKNMRGIRHPNILSGNHFDFTGNIPYLEMDYCDGGNLLDKAGKLSNDELMRVARDITAGLVYLHSQGIVHQDIKPENILFDSEQGHYLLSDFGISSKSRSRLSKSVNMANITAGMTEEYAPPEKFSVDASDRLPSTKGDIFSLGITLYELSTGVLPFGHDSSTGREMQFRKERKATLQLDFNHIKSEKLRTIIQQCMSLHKDDRPEAAEVMAMLDGKPEAEPPAGTSAPKKRKPTQPLYNRQSSNPPPPTPTPNRKWIYVAAAVVAVVLFGALLYVLPKGEPSAPAPEPEPPMMSQARGSSAGVWMEGNTLVFTSDGAEHRYRMVYVGGGSYTMGCTPEQGDDCYNSEKPAHSVSVGSFYMGQTEVTQALWKAVMGNNPSHWKGNNLPVESVSWNDCQEFIRKLSSLTGRIFRLPTEEEWEYAARGGSGSRGYKYSGSNDVGNVAWYAGNSGSRTHPVGQKQANELGLYDMSGNVWEWCSSGWSDDYSSARSGSIRVVRGGGWSFSARRCRVSCRDNRALDHRLDYDGLRLVLFPLVRVKEEKEKR